jgi:glycerophosphoryl diester phosphodiesterase
MPEVRSLLLLPLVLIATLPTPAAAGVAGVRQLLEPGTGWMMIVAHRGCHKAAPAVGLPEAPENSLAALENCVALGVDMLEIDVRRSADGELVVIHDANVDRTTDGTGRVAAMAVAQLQALRLRQGLGGSDVPLTAHRIPTLDEMLAAAKGRILLNLDVKEPVYVEAIDAVLRAGMEEQVIVKAQAGPRTRALAAMAPFDRVPFAPILQEVGGDMDLVGAAARQTLGARPIAFELPVTSPERLMAVGARTPDVPLWVNTLWSGFVTGWGGDADAVRNPDHVWGRLYRAGVRIVQTDEPAALLAYRAGLLEAAPARKESVQ